MEFVLDLFLELAIPYNEPAFFAYCRYAECKYIHASILESSIGKFSMFQMKRLVGSTVGLAAGAAEPSVYKNSNFPKHPG